MENKKGVYKKAGEYHFYMKPDKTMFALEMPDGRRIMCHGGNPYNDKMFTFFLESLDNGKVSKVLRPLLRKNYIKGDNPVLMNCTDSGFRFIRGQVEAEIETISFQIQKLISIYCSKNKNKDNEEVAEIHEFPRGVV